MTSAETEAAQRAAVVSEARSWVGTRFRHRSRAKGVGVDCGNLLAAVYEAAGVVTGLPMHDYPRDWFQHSDEERLRNTVTQYARPVDKPGSGDIVLFRFGKALAHAAIVVDWPRIIHANALARVVVIDDVSTNTGLVDRVGGFWSPWGGA